MYEPEKDSYLLQESLEDFLKKTKNNNISILDMGSGKGIQAITCKNQGFDNILSIDINPDSERFLKKHKIKFILSDLFKNINKNEKFNLIIFNPPYLPDDKKEPKDSKTETTAGKNGYELIIKFLTQARSHLKKPGTILLLFSSLSRPEIILKKAKELSYEYRLINKKKIFFEELYVYEIFLYQES